MKRLLFISWIFLLSVSFGLTKVKADIRMPLIFGDHMVLQQDTKIAIFGWADAGETVEVVFAGQKVKTTADTDGTWKVNLKPIKTKKEGQLGCVGRRCMGCFRTIEYGMGNKGKKRIC